MDSERLTPYLRRRVLNLSQMDRLALQRELAESLRHPDMVTPADKLAAIASRMDALSGVDVRQRSRAREVVLARSVLVFVARMEGISQLDIGRFLGQDHSTISFSERRMRTALSMPHSYPDYINLYNRYTKEVL